MLVMDGGSFLCSLDTEPLYQTGQLPHCPETLANVAISIEKHMRKAGKIPWNSPILRLARRFEWFLERTCASNGVFDLRLGHPKPSLKVGNLVPSLENSVASMERCGLGHTILMPQRCRLHFGIHWPSGLHGWSSSRTSASTGQPAES